jgi:hypothetical protein
VPSVIGSLNVAAEEPLPTVTATVVLAAGIVNEEGTTILVVPPLAIASVATKLVTKLTIAVLALGVVDGSSDAVNEPIWLPKVMGALLELSIESPTVTEPAAVGLITPIMVTFTMSSLANGVVRTKLAVAVAPGVVAPEVVGFVATTFVTTSVDVAPDEFVTETE